jgi:hypothetical protein
MISSHSVHPECCDGFFSLGKELINKDMPDKEGWLMG